MTVRAAAVPPIRGNAKHTEEEFEAMCRAALAAIGQEGATREELIALLGNENRYLKVVRRLETYRKVRVELINRRTFVRPFRSAR